MKISVNNSYVYLLQLCLFLFIFVPFYYLMIKLPLFSVALAIGTLLVLRSKQVPIHEHVLILFVFYLSLGLFYSAKGYFSPVSGHSLPFVTALYVGFPLIYFFMVLVISNRFALVQIHRTIIFSVLCSSIYTICILISDQTGGWLPVLDGYYNAAFRDGGSAIATSSVSPMIFVLPYLMVGMIVKRIDGNAHNVWHRSKWSYLIICSLLIFVAVILAGRRIVIVVIATLPIVLLVYGSLLPRNIARSIYRQIFAMIIIGSITVVLIATIMVTFFDFKLSYLTQEFITSLFDASNKDNKPRYRQAAALINGWRDAPIFGTGHGTHTDYTRGSVGGKPWRYELSYLSLAFHTGLVGLFCYSVGFLWLVWTSFRLLSINPSLGMETLPCIAGLFAMILAYGTNPYFDAFDILWTIFFPLAYVNWALRYTLSKR